MLTNSNSDKEVALPGAARAEAGVPEFSTKLSGRRKVCDALSGTCVEASVLVRSRKECVLAPASWSLKASAETNGVPVDTRSGRARMRAAAAARWARAAPLVQAPACGPQSLAAAAPDPRASPGLARARVTRARAATARCSRAGYCEARRRRFARARIYQGWRRWGRASPPAPGVGRARWWPGQAGL